MPDHALKSGGNLAVCLAQLRRFFLQTRAERLDCRLAMKRPLPAEHLVKDHSEREDVGAMVDTLAAHLFGRHVANRPHNDAGIGVHAHRFGFRFPIYFACKSRTSQLRQTKIKNLDAAISHDEEIIRLEIAVYDALLMRGRETFGDLQRIFDRLALRQSCATHSLTQRLAFEQFRDHVGGAVEGIDIIDRENIGMIESPRGLCFLFEPPQSIGVCGKICRKNFDRHVALKLWIVSAVDFAHAARADLRADFIAAKLGALRDCHYLENRWRAFSLKWRMPTKTRAYQPLCRRIRDGAHAFARSVEDFLDRG